MRKYLLEVLTLLGSDKRRLPGIIFLFLVASVLDLAGIGLIGPYVAMIATPDATNDVISKLSLWINIPTKHYDLMLIMGGVLTGVFLVKAVTTIWINYVITRFSEDQQIRIRSLLMKNYMSLPYVDYLNRNSSEYIHSTQTLVGHYAGGVVNTMLKTLSDSIVAVVIIIFLVLTNPLALFILISMFGIFLIIYDVLFRKNIREFGVRANFYQTSMVQAIHEGIEGLKELRILGREKYFQDQVQNGAINLAKYNIRSIVISNLPRYILEFLMVFFVVLLTVVTLLLEGSVEHLLPTLAIFGVAAIRLLPAANSFSSNLMRLRYYRDSVSILYNDLQTILMGVNIDNNNNLDHTSSSFKNINLKDVNFRYPGAKKNALHEITMNIHCGESIGLIGASGSGKTTLVDTLLGMVTPNSGIITFNDTPLQNSLMEWRSHIAYLPQQVFLIDNSLRKNIALGVDDDAIDDERLNSSLQLALLSELVDQLPEGVHTNIGERGARLSGGQRQRVALARAFYHGRDVLVLDEATSALDNETEKEIVAEIKRFKGKKTMIIIAHRFSTVEHCDRIYKLEKGKIIASGTPQEMLDIN